MDKFEHYKKIIKALHKTDLSDIKNLSYLFDMCLAIKEFDIELAKEECQHVKNRAAVLSRKNQKAVDLYWKAILFLAQNRDLDSYLLYLEKNRDPEDRFYLPRRKQLRKLGLIQALQDLIDDKIEILSISCPPGVGKAQPLYSKVLTPHGFVNMGDIHIGDTVISGEGRNSKVIGVYPQGVKKIYEIIFDDGSKVRCSDKHLWKVQTRDDRRNNAYRIIELREMLPYIYCEYYSVDSVYPNDYSKTYRRYIVSVDYVGEEECQCIMIDDPCHLYITDNYVITHNTTLAEMFLSGWIGWDPDACNLFSSHSGHVTRMVYDVLCNIIGVDLKHGQIPEYTWREIFPNVQIEGVNAKEETINLGKFKSFKTITFRALGASQTGVTRAEGLLYCDDLCSGIEEALSKIRLDKLWTKYSTDLKTRKKKGRKGRVCKELHIATRWSVWDVIGRLQRLYEGKKKKCKFIAIPDLDPETGLSNWDYQYGVGFDEEYFQDIADTLDDVTYRCLYKNDPVEREGLLYDPDKLRRYNGILPPGKEPDQILAILDPKGTGTDFNCMGVFYQFGDDYYLHDVVFKNIDPYLLDDYNADCLVRNNVQICQIESNKEGVRSGDEIQKKVDDQGGRCCIEKKYTTTNKETRIIVNSPWVIKHIIFKAPECYAPKSDYGEFMSWLCAFSQLGKNPHDDAPDMVAMLAVRESGTNGVQTEVYGTDQRSLLGL